MSTIALILFVDFIIAVVAIGALYGIYNYMIRSVEKLEDE